MPIVTLTVDNKTRYYAVTEGSEAHLQGLVQEYKLAESDSRERLEHPLQVEYLKRLTEHAYDCAQLAHHVENPPDNETLLAGLQTTNRLMRKVVESAIWLRTYEPFTVLTADVVAGADYGTLLVVDDRRVSSHDDDSWEDARHALAARSPWHREHQARLEQQKRAERAAVLLTPAGQKRVDAATKEFCAALDYATKLKKRGKKTVANKSARRSKRTRGGR